MNRIIFTILAVPLFMSVNTAAFAQTPAPPMGPVNEVPTVAAPVAAVPDNGMPASEATMDTDTVRDTDSVDPGAAPAEQVTSESPAVQTAASCAFDTECPADQICNNGFCIDLPPPGRAVPVKTTLTPAAPKRNPVTRQEGLISIYFPVAIYWRTDSGYDFFSTDPAMANPGVGLDVDFLNIDDKWRFSAGFTWLQEKLGSDNVSGVYTTLWLAENFTLSLKARYQVLPWLSPHARIFGGVSVSQVKVNQYMQDWTPDFVGGVGAGVSFHTPSIRFSKNTGRMPIFSAGVLLEGGFEFGPDVDVTLDLSEDGAHPIDTISNGSGWLDRTAPYFRMEFFLRF